MPRWPRCQWECESVRVGSVVDSAAADVVSAAWDSQGFGRSARVPRRLGLSVLVAAAVAGPCWSVVLEVHAEVVVLVVRGLLRRFRATLDVLRVPLVVWVVGAGGCTDR